MEYRVTILGRFNGLNEFINANRTNPHKGNKMKQDAQETILYQLRNQLHHLHITKPVRLKYEFWEPNKKRDLDNISGFFHKVFQDSLVKSGILVDDGWDEIKGYTDEFYCDKAHPRVEVTITEVET